MGNETDIFRHFRIGDAEMLSYVGLIHTFYVDDLADFTAFDPDFDASYADNFLTAIKNAELHNSDNQLIDVVASATLNVEEKMTACRDYFFQMKYFIEKAFPDKRAVWNEFGYNAYKECRRSQLKMIQFMYDLHKTAEKYAATLTAANFDPANIAEIKNLAEALQTANIEQESLIKERSTERSVRVDLLNQCWDICQHIRKAAKVIYANNWGKWQRYTLPKMTKQKGTSEPS